MSDAQKRGIQKHKPCPFCGETPEWEPWHGGGPTKIRIGCASDRCMVSPSVTGETPSEAAARWNTRIKPATSNTDS